MTFSDAQLDRYARHMVLREIGGAGQARLLDSHVLVVGAGGLGAPLLMYLAAAGVGHIRLVDGDRVALSNLQRQVIYHTSDVDRLKVDSAAERIAAINPDVQLETVPERLTGDNAAALMDGMDVVADGSDNFTTRLAVADAALAVRLPLVTAMLSSHLAQLATFKPHDGPDLPCYRCFMPDHPGEEGDATCAEQGIMGALAGMAGSLQALEVIRELVPFGNGLAGRLMLLDGLEPARTRTLTLKRDPACPACADLVRDDRKGTD
ncbi:HesA/MoeB/ThiF family protein [Yunchengibacter salinarum]|uniref:HesA/MoeB/ThiF family protein n=1 Tax=Yunchengibacter salinarum TaxID=3133399 RepID=UPI0035B67F33